MEIPYYFGIAQEVMLYQEIGFAESFGITSPTARNDASARLCEASYMFRSTPLVSKKRTFALLVIEYLLFLPKHIILKF
jgi:hypothetical protein